MFLVIKKKFVIIFLICLVLTIGSCTAYFTVKATNSPATSYTIVIDPGHGGVDPGSVGRKTETTESELNLKISLKLYDFLKSSGFNVVLTRSNADGLYGTYSAGYKKRDMTARKEIILNSNADLVISVHMNSFTKSTYRGAQVFYNTNNQESQIIANYVQQQFANDLPQSDKGTSLGDYFILKCTNIPTILCECGYLSNPEDEALLITEEYQQKVARSIYAGIVNYFNSKPI